MSKIDELIKDFCPMGVTFKSLAEVTYLKAGDRIIKSMMNAGQEYKVYGGGTSPTGSYEKYNFEKSITISRAGSAGHVNWVEGKFWATDVCFVASQKQDNVLIKFVYYFVKSQQTNLQKHLYGGSMPKLDKSFLWNLPVPVPPLVVQKEIVNILDKFTQFEAELSAELDARRKQYEFYRNQLLNFDESRESVRWLALGDVFEMKNGYTPSKKKREYWTDGNIAWFRMDDIRENGRILDDSIQHITKEAVKGGQLFPANSLIISTSATIGEHALITTDFLSNQRFTVLTPKKEHFSDLDMKYIFYYGFLIDEWCKKHTNMSGFASVDMNGLRKLKIALPELERQRSIVNILDKFDKHVHDIYEGLPAEINARHQQYEYYRTKLLTFQELPV